MHRTVAPLVAAAFLATLVAPLVSSTSHFTAEFRTGGGNEWWVETRVDASAPLAKVEASANGGAWRALTLRSWGAWAASFHVPDGSTVTFRATSTAGAVATSGAYLWPSGSPTSGNAPPPEPAPSGSYAATFAPHGGNEWWVQVKVDSAKPLAGVDARVNGGPWSPLALKSWGSWAKSMEARAGATVEFRARATDGAHAQSGAYRWPDGTPTGAAPTQPAPTEPTGFTATFRPHDGNAWWVQARVDANRALAGVDARVNGGAWKALELRSWGSWAAGMAAPSGSVVEFRARAGDGAAVVSGGHRWPDGTPTTATNPPPTTTPPPSGAGLRVTLDPWQGPFGGGRVHVDRDLYGMNLADWHPWDYRERTEPFTTYLRALQPGVLRWPAGHSSQEYVWERTRGEAWGPKFITTAHLDDFVAFARSVGAEPVIAVNMKTATPAQAADMVVYANEIKRHDVRYWQLGNEPDHRDGKTSGPEQYAYDAERFARAMRAKDPGIFLIGGELMTGAHVVGSNGQRDWMTPIMQVAGDEVDALSWHYYPLDSGQPNPGSGAYPTVQHLFQETSWDWKPAGMSFVDEAMPHLKGIRNKHSPGSQIWITEIAEDSGAGGADGISGAVSGMLWTADIMGRLAAHDVDAVTKFVFKSGDSHRYTLLDADYNPRPAYYAYWMYARHFGDELVKAASDDKTKVAAHAAVRDDGALTVMLVNKGGETRTVNLDLGGFSATSAQRLVVQGASMSAKTVTLNGGTLHAGNVHTLAPQSVPLSDATSATLPPYSATLLVLKP